MISFNLFRRRRSPELYCAVPEDLSVPSFVHDEEWEFGGKADKRTAPRGFDIAAALASVRFNGFYIFQGC